MQDLKTSNLKQFQIRKPIIKAKGMREANHYEEYKQELKRKNLYSIQKNNPKNMSIFKQPIQTKEIFLTEEYIKNSKIYKMLQDQIQSMTLKHQQELEKLYANEKNKTKQIEQLEKDTHNTKIQIWEIKNEIMELENQINYQEQEYGYIMDAHEEQFEESKLDDNLEQEDREIQQIQSQQFIELANEQEVQNPEKQIPAESSNQFLELKNKHQTYEMHSSEER